MGKHLPTVIWMMRRIGVYPNGWVETASDDRIAISYTHGIGHGVYRIELSRKDARLLAKRINQCLDDTRG